MGGRVVAAERHAEAEQADHQRDEIGADDEQGQKGGEDDHLGDEHRAAAETVGEAAEEQGADEDAEQARGTDQAVVEGGDVELARDQRQGHAGHEDDEAFEELAGGGEAPDAPLHGGHGSRRQRGAVGPGRALVDIVLDGAGGPFGG